jgi:CDP-glucose 4,6-dehydratase
MTREFWKGRRVLLTGVTGFKGGWLTLWLRHLGAHVVGYSLPPPTAPAFFDVARLREAGWIEADIRDLSRMKRAVEESAPEVVFHLAAQPLVRASYGAPIDTFTTNVLGTANLLEALREQVGLKAVVVVTTDKCYENREWLWPYRETDPLGGHDPYSSSKACAELVSSSFYRSFFRARGIGVATARAGNVIGGGDWSLDRLIPDMVAAFARGESAFIRNPGSVRPWQHVLEPLLGYLMLAERLAQEPMDFSEGWNFGPDLASVKPVSVLATSLAAIWGEGARWHTGNVVQPHEAGLLALDASKARARLGWSPRLGIEIALEWSARWYKAFHGGEDMRSFSLRQLRNYEEVET